MDSSLEKKTWYSQGWPWLLIMLPATAVIASLVTAYIFHQNQVALVSQDYYKEGKAINQDLTKLRRAYRLGISAQLYFDENVLLIDLNKGKQETYTAIKLNIQHRTLPEKDIQQMLTPDATGKYRLSLTEPLVGPWFVEIGHYQGAWLIDGKANFSSVNNLIRLQGSK